MNKTIKLTEELVKLVKANTNTKTEIRRVVEKLSRNTQVFKRDSTQEWWNKNKTVKVSIPTQEAGVQTKVENSNASDKKNVSTQTNPWHGQKGIEVLHSIEKITTLEQWRDQAHKQWELGIQNNTEIKEGNPLDKKDMTVKVVIVKQDDRQMSKSLQKNVQSRYPELSDDEDFEVLEQCSKLKIKGVNETINKKNNQNCSQWCR